MRREERRRGDHRRTHARHQGDGDHVARDYLAKSHAHVEPFGDDVHQRVVADDLHFDIGIACQEARDHRQQRDACGDETDADTQLSGHAALRNIKVVQRIVDVAKRRTDA